LPTIVGRLGVEFHLEFIENALENQRAEGPSAAWSRLARESTNESGLALSRGKRCQLGILRSNGKEEGREEERGHSS